jgi:ABC-type molybdenum transport system ATPase subunit/photorepair protein PhrA
LASDNAIPKIISTIITHLTQIKEKYYITQLLFINHHDHDIKKNLKSRWNESPPPNAAWKK